MTKGYTTNGDIYELVDNRVDRLRLEVKGDIKNSFDDLTKQIADLKKVVNSLSQIVNDQKTAQAVNSTKIGLITGGISLIVSAFATMLINRLKGF